MARINSLDIFLTDIANSIRSKKGTTEKISPTNFDTEIESIQGGEAPNLQSKSINITSNGTTNVTPDDGYDGLDKVAITTNVSGGGDNWEINDCTSLFTNDYRTSLIPVWLPHCKNITKVQYMFNNNTSSITDLDLSTLNTSKVSDFSSMVSNNSKLKTLNVDNFNTSNAITMYMMFRSNIVLLELNLNHFNTSKVTNMGYMFNECRALQTLNIDNFDTSKVTYITSMFAGCRAITSLNVSSFDISNVTSIDSMFSMCYALEELDLSNFKTSKVTNITGMFYCCYKLKSLDLSGFTTANLTKAQNTFLSCYNLATIDLSGLDLTKIKTMSGMFTNCGRDLSSPTIVYVKDATSQNWVLTANNGHPTTWSTENVIIK